MKKEKILSCTLLLFVTCGLGKSDPVSVQEKIKTIRWIESSSESKEVFSMLKNVSNPEMSIVTRQALKTGNIDLIDFVRQRLESENWNKERSWQDGLEMASRHAESFEVLGKWNSKVKGKFKDFFSMAPDVPYQTINEWHSGFGFRGLQGVILKVISTYDKESFSKVIKMLSDESVSKSKKRTIVWAMRYDLSGESTRILRSETPHKAGVPKKDIEESLSVLEKSKTNP